MPPISHAENMLFAKSTPMVIVLMETSSSADGSVVTPSWPSRPKGEEVSFYSFEADGSAAAQLKR
jgi:hypothetical protein